MIQFEFSLPLTQENVKKFKAFYLPARRPYICLKQFQNKEACSSPRGSLKYVFQINKRNLKLNNKLTLWKSKIFSIRVLFWILNPCTIESSVIISSSKLKITFPLLSLTWQDITIRSSSCFLRERTPLACVPQIS